MLPEITVKDQQILAFLLEFKVATKQQLRKFVGFSQKNEKRLIANDRIEVNENYVSIKNMSVDEQEKENILFVLDVLLDFIKAGFIAMDVKEIRGIDLPYYAMAKHAKAGVFIYFTIIRKGKEAIRCRLIDNENRGNVVLILENREQLSALDLKTKVTKVVYLNEVVGIHTSQETTV